LQTETVFNKKGFYRYKNWTKLSDVDPTRLKAEYIILKLERKTTVKAP